MKRILLAAALAIVSAPAGAADECRIYAKPAVQEGTFFQEEGVWQWCLPLDWEWEIRHSSGVQQSDQGDHCMAFQDTGWPARIINRVRWISQETGKDTVHGRKLYRHCRRSR